MHHDPLWNHIPHLNIYPSNCVIKLHNKLQNHRIGLYFGGRDTRDRKREMHGDKEDDEIEKPKKPKKSNNQKKKKKKKVPNNVVIFFCSYTSQ